MARIGETSCPLCNAGGCKVSETKTGTLTLTCGKCEFSGYGTKGTRAARLIRDKLTPDPSDETPPGTPPPPAPPKPKAGFSLDDLR